MSLRSSSDSMMIRLGVEAFLKKATAACAPPMCTVTCALARRRSCAAFSITAAVSWSSQKAWMLMRGIGRAREASCGGSAARSKAGSLSALELSEYAASPITGRLRGTGRYRSQLACSETACRSEPIGSRHLAVRVFAPHHVAALAGSLRLAARMQRGPRDWRPSPQDCAGWRSPCRAKACSADRGRYSPTNPGSRGARRRTVDKTAARAPQGRHCRNTARARPSADRCRRCRNALRT